MPVQYTSTALVKADLRVTHAEDDALLATYILAAEAEALQFLNRTKPPTAPADYPEHDTDGDLLSTEDEPSSEDPVIPSFTSAIFFLVRSKYEAATPKEVEELTARAHAILHPMRIGLGV